MKMTILFLFTTLFISTAQARKPAVEDFVGIEPESYKVTPKGTEVVFDFGNKLESITKEQLEPEVSPNSELSPYFEIFAFLAFLALPMFMWVAIGKVTKDSKEEVLEDQFQGVSNLSDYRKDDEVEEEESKKAS